MKVVLVERAVCEWLSNGQTTGDATRNPGRVHRGVFTARSESFDELACMSLSLLRHSMIFPIGFLDRETRSIKSRPRSSKRQIQPKLSRLN